MFDLFVVEVERGAGEREVNALLADFDKLYAEAKARVDTHWHLTRSDNDIVDLFETRADAAHALRHMLVRAPRWEATEKVGDTYTWEVWNDQGGTREVDLYPCTGSCLCVQGVSV